MDFEDFALPICILKIIIDYLTCPLYLKQVNDQPLYFCSQDSSQLTLLSHDLEQTCFLLNGYFHSIGVEENVLKNVFQYQVNSNIPHLHLTGHALIKKEQHRSLLLLVSMDEEILISPCAKLMAFNSETGRPVAPSELIRNNELKLIDNDPKCEALFLPSNSWIQAGRWLIIQFANTKLEVFNFFACLAFLLGSSTKVLLYFLRLLRLILGLEFTADSIKVSQLVRFFLKFIKWILIWFWGNIAMFMSQWISLSPLISLTRVIDLQADQKEKRHFTIVSLLKGNPERAKSKGPYLGFACSGDYYYDLIEKNWVIGKLKKFDNRLELSTILPLDAYRENFFFDAVKYLSNQRRKTS